MTRLAALLLMTLWLGGCSLFSSSETPKERDPLHDLGRQVAHTLAEKAPWAEASTPDILLLPPTTIDQFFPAPVGHFREALLRAMLTSSSTLQVLAWPDATPPGELQADQWQLLTRLDAGKALHLTDRTLYPYTLALTLYHGHQPAPVWQHTLRGALDASALNETRRY
ncbi:hypothetical protein [Larsenimonas rhizosphaerae]|uniref:hypothetical protein n=1 Tax=Larsenimonas rhizosphaerae TaxID=2944682 RepID=UPI002033692B|nr:hypothetical protein [Larsenimonas rhizosphaerae]MCM2129739.1 hypothetical protein [Larsenimonas rhizosphaerae]